MYIPVPLKTIFSYLGFALVVLIFLCLYIEFSGYWVTVGRTEEKYSGLLLNFEFPLIILVLTCFYFSSIKNKIIRYLLPLYPLLILYLLMDAFYNFLGRSAYLSDFENFASVMTFSALMGLVLILLYLSIPVVIFYLVYKARKNSVSTDSFINKSLFLRLALLVSIFASLNSQTFIDYHNQKFDYVVWSQEDTIRNNGKFSSFIYYSHQERSNLNKLKHLSHKNSDNNRQQRLFPEHIKQPRNIHLIVLESFIDPRKIKDIEFSQPILAEAIKPYLSNNQDFSLVTSPIYGGGTAQAEFELLTGVPALAKVNRIEYNVMQGGSINSFVKALNENNYTTMASIATGTGFFNSKQAYQSLGFDQVNYLEENPLFEEALTHGPIFDGDVFEFNLNQLRRILAQRDGPVFNYVLGMYGHLPFRRNLQLRPDRAVVSHPDERVKKIANQFYYRTQAIARYLEELMVLDPTAIIYITSDHLPSILNQETVYTLDNKTNIALFFDASIKIDISGKKLYQLPWLIWDRLSQQEHLRELNDTQLEAFYYQVLAESLSR